MKKFQLLPFPTDIQWIKWLESHLRWPYFQIQFQLTSPSACQPWGQPEAWCGRDYSLSKTYPDCRIYNAGFEIAGVTFGAGICIPQRRQH